MWESNFTPPVTASARWRGPHRPAAAGERGPDAVELFGAALPPGPGEVLVVANFGILHMPASAGDPNKFEARTKHALRRLDKISRAAGLSVTVLLVAPPTLRGLRSPGLHPAQLEAFAPAMKRLATEGLGVSVRVLDVAPLSAARADATFDGPLVGAARRGRRRRRDARELPTVVNSSPRPPLTRRGNCKGREPLPGGASGLAPAPSATLALAVFVQAAPRRRRRL